MLKTSNQIIKKSSPNANQHVGKTNERTSWSIFQFRHK